jgi:hypothetical protein
MLLALNALRWSHAAGGRQSLTVSRTDQEGATVLLDARTENPVGELVYANGENCPPPPCLIADLALDGTVLAPV